MAIELGSGTGDVIKLASTGWLRLLEFVTLRKFIRLPVWNGITFTGYGGVDPDENIGGVESGHQGRYGRGA